MKIFLFESDDGKRRYSNIGYGKAVERQIEGFRLIAEIPILSDWTERTLRSVAYEVALNSGYVIGLVGWRRAGEKI